MNYHILGRQQTSNGPFWGRSQLRPVTRRCFHRRAKNDSVIAALPWHCNTAVLKESQACAIVPPRPRLDGRQQKCIWRMKCSNHENLYRPYRSRGQSVSALLSCCRSMPSSSKASKSVNASEHPHKSRKTKMKDWSMGEVLTEQNDQVK